MAVEEQKSQRNEKRHRGTPSTDCSIHCVNLVCRVYSGMATLYDLHSQRPLPGFTLSSLALMSHETFKSQSYVVVEEQTRKS